MLQVTKPSRITDDVDFVAAALKIQKER